jgi:hypothetical protein
MTSPLSYGQASYRRSAGGAEATATTSYLSVMAFLKTLLQFISSAPSAAKADQVSAAVPGLTTIAG